MYVINPSFLCFIVHCYTFQNEFEIKIFENGDIIFGARLCWKNSASRYQV